MKYRVQTVVGVLLFRAFCSVLPACAKAGEGGAGVVVGNDVESTTKLLPQIYGLWPEHPKEFVQFAKEAARVLQGAASRVDARQALSEVFSKTAEATVLPDLSDSASLLRMKCDAMLGLLDLDEIRNDPSTWLTVAKAVGEMRAQVLPNYMRRGRPNPPGLMAASRQEAERLVRINEGWIAKDRFQQELRVTDRKLTFLLLANVRRMNFNARDPQTEKFAESIAALARLSVDEARQLQ